MDGNGIKQTPETQPGQTPVSPEAILTQPAFENLSASPEVAAPVGAIERVKTTEQALNRSEASPAAQPIMTATPQTGQPMVVSEPSVQSAAPVAGGAGHGNKIEPQWVAQLDRVMAEHRGDPHNEKIGVDELRDQYRGTRYPAGEG